MKKALVQILVFVTGLVLFIACDQGAVYDEFKPVPSQGWSKDSMLIFEIPVTDTLQNHNLYINIRNDVKYKYSNLWLFIEIEEPNGTAATDTFEITLADPSGKWLGNGFSGVKTLEAVYKRNIFFPASGDYRIQIEQGMREDVLKGITDIGVRLEKQQ